MNEKDTQKAPETTVKTIREAIIQSTSAAFKDPAVQRRFQEWKTRKKAPSGSGE